MIVSVYFLLCPCLQEIVNREARKKLERSLGHSRLPSHVVPILFSGIVWGCGLRETMTSKYVMESRAGHVTFPRVFPIGLWGIRYSLFIILLFILIREYGSTLYVGLARAVSPTNTNFRLTFLLTKLQEALYEDLAV